jgi:pyridoxamine 5'-phosphate oxidase family protein
MSFKPYEIAYLEQADLGRLATVQRDGTVQNSPVGFSYNADHGTIDIVGFHMSASQKFRNLAHNPRVAFVVDDIASRDPWRVRCLEIRGTAEQAWTEPSVGKSADERSREEQKTPDEVDSAIIRITPTRIISFGIDDLQTAPHELTADIRDV